MDIETTILGPWKPCAHLTDRNRPFWVIYRIHDTCPKTLERVMSGRAPRRFYDEGKALRFAERLNAPKGAR